MQRQEKWNLKDGVAELDWPSFRLRIDASTPELGGQVVFSKATADFGADEPSSSSHETTMLYCFRLADRPIKQTRTRRKRWRPIAGAAI